MLLTVHHHRRRPSLSLINYIDARVHLTISLVIDFASHYLIIAITDYRPEHMSISPPMPLAGKIIKITMVVAISNYQSHY